MSFYHDLQEATAEERAALLALPFIQAGAAGDLSLRSYVAFLGQAYHHVKHTVPLLMACGAALPARLEWLRGAVAEYIDEELGHEEWILNDLRSCGADAEALRQARPMLATELMVAYAYDTIQRCNPVAFFGMVQVLEGTSIQVATQAAEALQSRLGLPATAFSYLTSHGSLDIGHVEFFEKLMNRIDDPRDQADIIHCARVMYRLYGDIFRSLPLQAQHEEVGNATAE